MKGGMGILWITRRSPEVRVSDTEPKRRQYQSYLSDISKILGL